MEIVRSPVEMKAWSDAAKQQGGQIALVPTMGYFHEGHLSLMRMASKKADKVVVSLFVNPIQFGPSEDLDKYPRDFDHDVSLATAEKVDVLFAPGAEQMYPEPILTNINVAKLTDVLCGQKRPGHFDGVATVVAKLFNIVAPQVAVFGGKDFQQLAVIRRLVKDLNFDIDIIGHPIVRETDGLAMSSRNTYLSREERRSALCLYKAIQFAKKNVTQGERESGKLVRQIKSQLESYNDVRIDYVNIVDKDSLIDQETIDERSWLVMAVYVGKTRLIDNSGLFEGV